MNVLKPSFYDDFTCIGTQCKLTCCGGWKIPVEKEKYDEYLNGPDDIRRLALKAVVYDENDGRYYINVSAHETCMFCDDKQLCGVYINIGPDAMSKTCTEFPRGTGMVLGTQEKSLSLGCPSVAGFLRKINDIFSFIAEGEYEEYYDENTNLQIRNSIIDLLQYSELPLWFRAAYSYMCIEKLDKVSEEKKKSQLRLLLSNQVYSSVLEAMLSKNNDEKVKFNSYINLVNTFEKGYKGIRFKEMYDTFSVIDKVIEKNKNIQYDEWKQAYDKLNDCFDGDYMMYKENMYVYNWFMYAFSSDDGSLKLKENIETTIMFVSLVEQLMILYISVYGRLSGEMSDIITAVGARLVDHGRSNVINGLRKDNCNDELGVVMALVR